MLKLKDLHWQSIKQQFFNVVTKTKVQLTCNGSKPLCRKIPGATLNVSCHKKDVVWCKDDIKPLIIGIAC